MGGRWGRSEIKLFKKVAVIIIVLEGRRPSIVQWRLPLNVRLSRPNLPTSPLPLLSQMRKKGNKNMDNRKICSRRGSVAFYAEYT
jgi:hypothetical protein